MIQIRKEAEDIITGAQPKDNNVLKNAPHPANVVALSEAEWNRYVAPHLLSYVNSHMLHYVQPVYSPECRISFAISRRKEVLANSFPH